MGLQVKLFFEELGLKTEQYNRCLGRFINGFPMEVRNDAAKVIKSISRINFSNEYNCISEGLISYIVNGSEIIFPYRIYVDDVSEKIYGKLNLKQKVILHCIYSRHRDGFIRQKHIEELLTMDYFDWAIPYIVKVCDEYVVEILEVVYDILKDKNTQHLKKFCLENPESFVRSYNRMISYWNIFYRTKTYNFKKYIGRKLFRECFGYTRALEKSARNK